MKEIITVSQLNDNIKFLLEETFGFVWVEGEVSNLRRPQSGHIYFTLKDEKSQIRAVYFRQFGRFKQGIGFELEEGISILCRARLSVYSPRGEYQLIVESAEPRGVGALQKLFEQLKAKLAGEGLFDQKYKKPIPFMPETIGIITSPTGAVIKDILNITKRRFPCTNLLIAPVRVQGVEAVTEIIQALHNLHTHGFVDVIIIARGGGSLEDLAPFNDEILAREIFRATIPIVSAVGHETDFTICDFVADLRAPTPSAAAEMLVPQRTELLAKLDIIKQRLISGYYRDLKDRKDIVAGLHERMKDPRRYLIDLQIHLDALKERLLKALRHGKETIYAEIRQLELRLFHQSPARQIAEKKYLIKNFNKDIYVFFLNHLAAYEERIHKNSAVLESLNPLSVLRRGYSITRNPSSGVIIRRASALSIGDNVNVQLARGSIDAKVQKITEGVILWQKKK
jgi:exodeoxyribonuclease VII large subunit